jgi:hypothetical protein
MVNSFLIVMWSWAIENLGHRSSSGEEFYFGSHSPPLQSSYPVLQLVIESVRSLVVLIRLCDQKKIWRNVM